MKRVFVFLLGISCLLLSACEDNTDKENAKEEEKDKLVGTTWKGNIGVYSEVVYVDFLENNKVTVTITAYNTTTATDNGSYKLSGNHITFTGINIETRVCYLSLKNANCTNSVMTINGRYCDKDGSWTYNKIN
ncbi:MAG: hypothetical protein UIQ51_02045 [Bacteroidales bacterium]|jgi:uncharacterized protein (TIGR03066 family)|nr:hypothetical protein [Bacteroidales bacterium]